MTENKDIPEKNNSSEFPEPPPSEFHEPPPSEFHEPPPAVPPLDMVPSELDMVPSEIESLPVTAQSYIEVPLAKTPKQAEKIEAQSDDSNKSD